MIWMQQPLITYLRHLATKGKRKDKMLTRWVVDLRMHYFKVRWIFTYLKAEHTELFERKTWTVLKRRQVNPVG